VKGAPVAPGVAEERLLRKVLAMNGFGAKLGAAVADRLGAAVAARLRQNPPPRRGESL
jgi:hypothetical protein